MYLPEKGPTPFCRCAVVGELLVVDDLMFQLWSSTTSSLTSIRNSSCSLQLQRRGGGHRARTSRPAQLPAASCHLRHTLAALPSRRSRRSRHPRRSLRCMSEYQITKPKVHVARTVTTCVTIAASAYVERRPEPRSISVKASTALTPHIQSLRRWYILLPALCTQSRSPSQA